MSEEGGGPSGALSAEWDEEVTDWLLTDPPIARGGFASRSHARALRRFFLARPGWFDDFQYTLLKAASATTYDVYLTRITLMAALLGLLGTVVTAAVQTVRQVPAAPLADPLAAIRLVPAPVLSVVVPAVLGGLLLASVTLWFGFTLPALRAWSRQRTIDALLPYGNILMYSLARGGIQLPQAVATIARARGPFGELAREYERVQRDVALFGRDVQTGLAHLRAKTPSDRLDSFIEELQAATHAGTSFREFMANQTERSIAESRREQEDLLELLTAFAQVYTVVAFVAPLFTLVLLVLLSLVGGDTLPLVYVLVYGYSPAVIVLAILAIHYLDVLTGVSMELPVGRFPTDGPGESWSSAGEVARAYRRRKIVRGISDSLAHPLGTLTRTPTASLVLTVPLAGLGALVAVRFGVLPTSVGGLADRPIASTGVAAILLLVPSVPLSVFLYLRRRRRKRLRWRFPELLLRLAEASEVGATFVDGCRLVVPRFKGPIGAEFDRFTREAVRTGDVEAALVRMAERVRLPEFRIATVVMVESYRSTEDIGAVLSALAESLDQRFQMETDRARAMRLYTLVLLLGVATFLGIVFFLDAFFFTELTRTTAGVSGTPELPFQPPAVDPLTYETVLFHSALIQGFGSGLLLGKLQTNRLSAGLKYGNVLVALSVVVFVFIV